MPLPAVQERSIQNGDKAANAPELSLRGGRRPTWQSRGTKLYNKKSCGEYGNFTRRGVEDAAPYKECVVGDNTRKFAAAKGAQGVPLQTQLVLTI